MTGFTEQLRSDFESMPNALMDCEGGGARFLIENEKNGLLTPAGDLDALAEAMRKMLTDIILAGQYG